MNGMRKVVVSSALTDPAWNNTTVIGGDAVAGVRALKDETEDGPILVNGSETLVHALLDAELVDELRLQVHPVSIGGGLRVFADTRQKTPWRLVDSRTFPSGVRADAYHPSPPAR
jgi:dihydrofolate reductase